MKFEIRGVNLVEKFKTGFQKCFDLADISSKPRLT